MKNRIAISGLGRIGRAILKKNGLTNDFKISFCNDINPDIKNLAYLLKYDTTYGNYGKEVTYDQQEIIINKQNINYLVNESLLDIDWDKHKTDILIISSGIEKSVLEAKELISKGKIKKAVVTHCSPNSDNEIVLGVNEETITKKHNLISNSICDANAIAHIIKWLHNEFEIISGSLTTLHPWLGYQNLLDNFSFSHSNPGLPWPDYALARNSTDNLIPKKTTALSAVEKVFPDIKNKLLSFSYRVPTNIVSSSDLTLELKKEVNLQELNNFLIKKSNESKYVTVNHESLVSQDYKRNESSAIIDMQWTQKKGNTCKIILWYDNEWGYSSRAIDLVKLLIQ